MIQIDLITGFLGSGKTTFIRHYVRHLTAMGQKVAIIENDYGAINIDRLLLQDIAGDNIDVEMIVSCPEPEAHKRRYKTKLISMAMLGYDRVIIEPSGIYDVDEFFDVLYESPIDERYEIGNVFAIVDSNLPDTLSEASEYMLCSQIACAGKVIFSKVQLSDPAGIKSVQDHIEKALNRFHCNRALSDADFFIRNWEDLTDSDLQELLSCGYRSASYEKRHITHGDAFQSLFFMNLLLTASELLARTKDLFADPSCGHVIRIKGFIPAEDASSGKDAWLEINATKKEQSLKGCSAGQNVLIIIGEDLDADRIRTFFPNAEYKGEIC